MVRHHLGFPKQAIELYEKSLVNLLRTKGERHIQVPIIYYGLGESWKELGEKDKGVEYYQKAFDLSTQRMGKNHSQTKEYKESLRKAKDEFHTPA